MTPSSQGHAAKDRGEIVRLGAPTAVSIGQGMYDNVEYNVHDTRIIDSVLLEAENLNDVYLDDLVRTYSVRTDSEVSRYYGYSVFIGDVRLKVDIDDRISYGSPSRPVA